MVWLSLFDGISCGRVALERAGIPVSKYYASEIDPFAIQVSKKNYPDIIRLGDITKVRSVPVWVDGILGGSPCQGFSFAGRQLNFNDPRSRLFFDFVRLLYEARKINPNVKFLLENVMMKKRHIDVISHYLGVQPVMINSNLVSAQNRKRLYWANFDISQPEDRGIFLKDILLTSESNLIYQRPHGQTIGGVVYAPKIPTINTVFQKNFYKIELSVKALDYMGREVSGGRTHWDFKPHSDVRNEKSAAVVANFFKGVPYNVLKDWDCIRYFHPIEVERLQTLPDNYTAGVSDTQRFRQCGNGWTVDIIAHILSNLRQ